MIPKIDGFKGLTGLGGTGRVPHVRPSVRGPKTSFFRLLLPNHPQIPDGPYPPFSVKCREFRELHAPSLATAKACVPVVAKLGPVVVGLQVGVGDEADALDLLVAVFRGRVQTQRRAVKLGKRLPPISVTSSVCGWRQTSYRNRHSSRRSASPCRRSAAACPPALSPAGRPPSGPPCGRRPSGRSGSSLRCT